MLPRSNDHVCICLSVNIEIKTSGRHIQQSELFDISLNSLVGNVAGSRKYIHFPLYAGFESHQCFHFFFFVFIVSYFHMYPLSIIGKQFNIYTKCPSNGTLSNTKTHMRDAFECINSIGYIGVQIFYIGLYRETIRENVKNLLI